jgi:hypothetical protein
MRFADFARPLRRVDRRTFPANHLVDTSDCKRALDSGVRRCKHSLGANIPFTAKSFYDVNVYKQPLHLDKHERLMSDALEVAEQTEA